jgi:hypothetical protein
MPVVIFFTCLDLEQKSSFMDGHWLRCTLFLFFAGAHEVPQRIGSRRVNPIIA